MTTTEILDVRRTDLRSNTLANPYWITSGQITPAGDDLATLLFSFPITKSVSPGYKPFYILFSVFEVITAFDGSGSITVGDGTLATDAVTTGGVVTEVDVDSFHLSDDITEGTIGYYPSSLTGTDSAFTTAAIAGVATHPSYITPADTTVPAIYASLTGGTITVGAARLHLLIAEIP
jgi:hypothetical protein